MVQVREMETKPADNITHPLPEAESLQSEDTRDNFPVGTRVKVIVNPASGKKAGFFTTNTAGLPDVQAVLEANGIEADIVETEHPGHATELARQAIKEGYEIIIACGGDGTVGETAKALIGNKKVTLGILPLGSANNVARMMNVPFDLAEAGKLLRTGKIIKSDVGRCNGEYFFETAGVGLDAALFPILNKVDKGELHPPVGRRSHPPAFPPAQRHAGAGQACNQDESSRGAGGQRPLLGLFGAPGARCESGRPQV